MSNEIELTSGRVVFLRELHQIGTYEGLLNGLPTKERNERLVARTLQERVHKRYAVPVHLIAPHERALEMPDGETYPFGTPAALPAVTCIGRFESLSPKEKDAGDASGLVVLWFQDMFQYPLSTEILAGLRAIDWQAHAGNFEY
jgi:hypothetical protein